jgi:hypothetical protein
MDTTIYAKDKHLGSPWAEKSKRNTIINIDARDKDIILCFPAFEFENNPSTSYWMKDQEISQWLDVDTDMTAKPGLLSRKEHTTNPDADNQSSPNSKLLREALSKDV